jgi:hypothetical protein
MTAKGAGGDAMVGNAQIAGLPFVGGAQPASITGVSLASYDNVNLDGAGGRTHLSAVLNSGTSVLALLQCGDNVGGVAVTVAELSDTTLIRGSLSYEI